MSAAWDLKNYDEESLYDLLRDVIENTLDECRDRNEAACQRHGWSMADFGFDDGDGRVNLLGARGFNRDRMEPCASSSMAWDDTLFVVYKEGGRKRVQSFYLNTEQNSIDQGSDPQGGLSFLMEGTHRYRLGHHGSSHQRALEPDDVVETLWDKNQNFKDDEGTGSQWIDSINIHYGGDKDSPQGWSAGCQTVKNQADFDAFRECVESDVSIKGSIDNEFAPQPSVDGDRVVIYTLVRGEALQPSGALPDRSEQPDLGTGPISEMPSYIPEPTPQPRTPGAQRPANGKPANGEPGNRKPGNKKPGGGRGSRSGKQPGQRPGGRAPGQRPTVQLGSSGSDVSALQRRLDRFGFDIGRADGIFGAQTERAVKAFQSAKKLPADGIVGDKTWAALARGRRRKAS